jgi:hypothetical protein
MAPLGGERPDYSVRLCGSAVGENAIRFRRGDPLLRCRYNVTASTAGIVI